jgi:hypothetical protein
MSTEIIVLLDRSGSMFTSKSEHEGGLNGFIQEQQKLDYETYFTLVQFDSVNPFEVVYDRVPIESVGEIRLDPRGGTPLLDAMGRTISHILSGIKDKPNVKDVVFVCLTDGQENASHEYSHESIKKLIEDNKSWTFLFLGANIDAFSTARSLGIQGQYSSGYNNFNAQAINNTYANVSKKILRSRSAYKAGEDLSSVQKEQIYCFTAEERNLMNDPQ